jgi:hypothetical protein
MRDANGASPITVAGTVRASHPASLGAHMGLTCHGRSDLTFTEDRIEVTNDYGKEQTRRSL